MTLDRPKHIEANSCRPKEEEYQNAPCSLEPQGGQSVSAVMMQTALGNFCIPLMEQVVNPANIDQAWSKVRANKGAPGPDGITIQDFPDHFRKNWPEIRKRLVEGTYDPGAARRKSIPKSDGSQRHLGIPNVMDRLIQQAILQVLTPIFDPHFSESSFGFRPGRSAQGAAKQVQCHIQAGYRQCIDMDLSKFFDRVQHDVLMVRVSRRVRDKRMLGLIGRYLRAGVMVDAILQPSVEGTMQGGPLSPLLANILLDDFDQELERRGLRFVRYADDFLVFTKTKKAASRVAQSIERYLTRKLKLVINHQKSRVCKTDGVEFLGFVFQGYGGQIRVSQKNQAKFKTQAREITRRSSGVSISSRLVKLRRFIQGWVGYFVLVPTQETFFKLDQWVRRRIRACYWKQWKNTRTRVKNLRNLGVKAFPAATHGNSNKGPWRMSKAQAIHQALSNNFLAEQGLVSLLEVWKTLTARKRIA